MLSAMTKKTADRESGIAGKLMVPECHRQQDRIVLVVDGRDHSYGSLSEIGLFLRASGLFDESLV